MFVALKKDQSKSILCSADLVQKTSTVGINDFFISMLFILQKVRFIPEF